MPSQRALRKKQSAGHAQPLQTSNVTSVAALGLLLVIGTALLYSPARHNDFINYDDREYVLNNPHVTWGLGWETVRWSLTATEQSNWHPLTWISHALDCQFFGLDPAYHHMTNVAMHSLAALLLFLFLQNATKMVVPSFLVATLFAWHPLNVESVAWVAERKNVLCTVFLFLTLIAYERHSRRPRRWTLVTVAVAFVLALASKPMAVSLPLLLMLLDYWPMQRVAGWTPVSAFSRYPQQKPWPLLREKLPLLALSAVSCVVTIWAQSHVAVQKLTNFPVAVRLENALYSCALYIQKTFWPAKLALFYPHPGISLPVWKWALAALSLVVISVAAWTQRKTRGYLLVGWLWFLIALIPVIGIVQVGIQGMADRYAYQPVVGLFLMVVWLAFDFFTRSFRQTASRYLLLSFVPVLLVMLALTSRQLRYWESSVTLWTHTLQVTSSNSVAEVRLAYALVDLGNNEEAISHFINAERIDPNDLSARVNVGAFYASQGHLKEGIQELEEAVRLTDNRPLSPEEQGYRCSALVDLAFAQALSQEFDKAFSNLETLDRTNHSVVDHLVEQIQGSLVNSPAEPKYLDLCLLLSVRKKNEEASSVLDGALRDHPEYSKARELLRFLTIGDQSVVTR